MGKDLRGKELGRGISQREEGLYVARYTNKYGRRVQKVLPKLQELPMEWEDIVFLCKKGTLVKNSTYDSMLFELCDKAGIDRFSMHVLRHTFATRCIEAGMKSKTLQTILGHSNIGITMDLYVHITEERKHKEIDLVADALKVI